MGANGWHSVIGTNRLKMAGLGAKFGRKKEKAIAAVLSQRNVDEASRVAGIGTRSLMRWLQMPEFHKHTGLMFEDAANELVKDLTAQDLNSMIAEAVSRYGSLEIRPAGLIETSFR